MEALANYDSDEEKDDKSINLKNDTGKSVIAGDNYDNVQMDLSEENSSSSSKAGGRTDARDETRSQSALHRSERNSNVRDDRRRDRDQTERRQHGKDRRRSPVHSSSSSRHHSGRDRYRTDDRRSHGKRSPPPRRRSRERSRSPSRRSPSRSSRRDHRRRSRSPGSSLSRSNKPESTSNTGEKSRSSSPPSLTSEQYLASLSLAQKLAQQVQPSAQQQQNAALMGSNPTLNRIQEQLQRRRMLWQQNKEPKEVVGASSTNNWEGALLPKDEDGTMTAKFKRLMGMKGSAAEGSTVPAVSSTETAQQQLKRQDVMFQDMERQYEVARLATHTHRGLGLGFGTFQCNYPQ